MLTLEMSVKRQLDQVNEALARIQAGTYGTCSNCGKPINPARLEALAKIQTYHVTFLAYFLERLKNTPDGDGSLLDHSLVLYGGAMSNSNVHNHAPLPILVAGGAAGRMQGGRHLKYPEDTPMANLLMTILDKAGIPQERVGDSTGLLSEV